MTLVDAAMVLQKNAKMTLLVDIDVSLAPLAKAGAALLASTKFTPAELWALPGRSTIDLAVISKARSPRELFQVLSLLAPLVSPSGYIVVPPMPDSHVAAFVELHNWEVFSDLDAIVLRKPHAIGRRVVSLSCFGDYQTAPEHWQRMPAYLRCFVLAHHALFPGYELVIHHDDAIYRSNWGDALHGLARRGLVRLVYMRDDDPRCLAMLWRLRPCWDNDVESVWCRDLDSIPTWLDRRIVEEAGAAMAAGNADLSAWSADPMHCGVMGGMSGFNAAAVRQLYPTWDDFIAAAYAWGDATRWATHGADQDFLNEIIAPQLNIIEHRTHRIKREDGSEAEPEPTLDNAQYVTTAADCDDEKVTMEVSGRADSFTNYPGASGYRLYEALEWYTHESPASAVVTDTQEFAGLPSRLRAVIGCDHNPAYAFYLPIVCLAWRRRLGASPLVLLVGTAAEWLSHPLTRSALERSRETGAEIWFVPEVPGVKTCTVAQVARIYACAVPTLRDDERLVTTDADMLPVGQWVAASKDPPGGLTVRYANAYADEVHETGRPHWPMCYVSGSVKTWREITGTTPGDFAAISRALESCPKDEQQAWSFDEFHLSELIARRGHGTQFIDRTFAEGEWRIDRSGWEEGLREANLRSYSLFGVADAHMPLPGPDNWSRMTWIIAQAFSDNDLVWVKEYAEQAKNTR